MFLHIFYTGSNQAWGIEDACVERGGPAHLCAKIAPNSKDIPLDGVLHTVSHADTYGRAL